MLTAEIDRLKEDSQSKTVLNRKLKTKTKENYLIKKN